MTEEMNWYSDETKPLTEISIEGFESLCKTVADQREKCDVASAALKEENKKLEKLEMKVLSYLKDMNRTNYPSAYGTVGIMRRTSVTTPKTPEDKAALFEYLRAKGLYESMVGVNSQTLNSFYRQELEIAEAEGRVADFRIPGLGEPTISETVTFRKAK